MAAPFVAILIALSIALGVLVIIFVLVPVLKGVGWLIGGIFQGIGWLFSHIFEFIGGVLGDALRFIGAIIAGVALVPLTILNVIIGRWSAAGHFAESVRREFKIGFSCLYRIFIRRPLKLVLLDGLLEGIEQRVPEAMAGAPRADKPARRTGQFDGYTIVGSLRGGGSGGKLFVAEPDKDFRRKGMPERVVIKSFALTEGSSLPQIVRESRALEAARQLGLVLDHGMEDHRFYYVMPFHDGDHLGVITRQLHGESDGRGLDARQLGKVMSYGRDLLHTLSTYHRGGLWHKDVKPENVIVHDGRANLVDLGLVTPLRSAMTLTTHGTEYFRDPEMVRQALRGVKVHQVDGAKFDIYAVGAVLYFVLENTFPAHGGLSRFQKKSPEALRWVVKRAMTDYHQRYATVDEMLADLGVIMSADDPYAVKPAALPSMTGGGVVAIDDAEDEVQAVLAAHTPRPQPQPGAAVSPAAGPTAVAAAVGAAAPMAAGRPRLRVTSWWTGDYVVDDPGAASGAASPGMAGFAGGNTDYREFRREASSFRAEAANLRDRVRAGAMSARKAAKEQVRAARTRAQALSRRARQRRFSHRAQERPSAFLAFLVMSVLVGGAIIGAAVVKSNRNNSGGFAITMPGISVSSRDGAAAASKRPALLVVDVRDRFDERTQRRLNRIIEEKGRAYNIVVEHPETEELYRELVAQWHKDGKVQGTPTDAMLEDMMAHDNLYGVLYVTQRRDGRLDGNVINSTNPAAAQRRRDPAAIAPPATPEPPPAVAGAVSHASTDKPILLVNDHPAKADPRVAERIASIVRMYEARGWTIVTDVDREVTIRKDLPIGPVDTESTAFERLNAALTQFALGGVLRIGAAPGDGDVAERIQETLIMARDVAAGADAAAPDDQWDAADH